MEFLVFVFVSMFPNVQDWPAESHIKFVLQGVQCGPCADSSAAFFSAFWVSTPDF